jgi:hypothetical protein
VGDRLAAVVADQVDLDGLAAGVSAGEERGVHRPLVAPQVEGEHDREQFPAGLGEMVLVAGRMLAVLPALDDAGSLQLAESVGEDVAGRAGVAGDAGEAVYAVVDLAELRVSRDGPPGVGRPGGCRAVARDRSCLQPSPVCCYFQLTRLP